LSKYKVVLQEVRDKAWEELFAIDKMAQEEIDKFRKNKNISKKDILKLDKVLSALEKRAKILDRVIDRTDPIKMQTSLSYEHILKLVDETQRTSEVIEASIVKEIERKGGE